MSLHISEFFNRACWTCISVDIARIDAATYIKESESNEHMEENIYTSALSRYGIYRRIFQQIWFLSALKRESRGHNNNANTVSTSYIVSVVYNLGKSIFTVYFTIGRRVGAGCLRKNNCNTRYASVVLKMHDERVKRARSFARSRTYRSIYFHCGNRRDSQSSGYL